MKDSRPMNNHPLSPPTDSPYAAPVSPTRRRFLQDAVVAGGGLMLYSLGGSATAGTPGIGKLDAAAVSHFVPNVFISIGSDGSIVLVSKLPEIGQGIKTALPMVLAEELEVPWQNVTVIQGDLNPAYGEQWAGGSQSTLLNFDHFLQLGATARTMLVQAAANTWAVPVAECRAVQGVVQHAKTARKLPYAQLAAAAAKLPVPDENSLVLKKPWEYTLLGSRVGGVDNAAIVTGKPLFGIDIKLPGMLYAVYEKCPVFGGKVLSSNLDAIRLLPGVVDAFTLEGGSDLKGLMPGVAIVARSTWAAFSARKQLKVAWNEGPAASERWNDFAAQAAASAKQTGASTVFNEGNVGVALQNASKTVEAAYQYPFIAHASLEPQNCTAWFKRETGQMEIWAPTQNPAAGQNLVASSLGLAKDKISVHLTRCGGGFGRRLSSDFMVEAAAIAKRINAPVKLTWSREDDFQHDHYRAGGFHFLKAGLDSKGKLLAWHNHFITFANRVIKDGRSILQPGSGGNLRNNEFPAHFVEHCLLEQTALECNIPMGPMRAPGSNVFAFVFQSFIDELAHAAGQDPLAFRLALLSDKDPVYGIGESGRGFSGMRMKRALQLLEKKSGWGKRAFAKGQGQGIAFHFSHGSYVAQVAEVTVSRDGKVKLDRVVAVCDIGGPVVNLSGAESQIQGSIIDGFSTLLYPQLDYDRGRMAQTNFNDYRLLRIPDTPGQIEVHFITTPFGLGGMGEPALPPLAPAVCNAIFAATGKRVRQLPLAKTDLRWS